MGGAATGGAAWRDLCGEAVLAVIFVTVGTTRFDDLVGTVDRLAPELDEQVLCQIARGDYTPRNCRYFRFAPTLEPHLRQADLIIGHGGLGTVMEAIRMGKPFIGVSNPDRPDLHQDEILGECASRGHIVWCRELSELPASIELARAMTFVRYVDPPCDIHTTIARTLHGSQRRSRAGAFGGTSL
jgi:beta-1,4-N-acetylglucosaminyltransferase